MSSRGRRFGRGFTLIELMIVVVIIGILSALAIYSVSDYIQKSKIGEAREIMSSIMAGQEAYHDETFRYLDVTGGVTDNDYYPFDPAHDGTRKIMWGADDACQGAGGRTCRAHYATLGVTVNSPVYFRYASTTFPAGTTPPVGNWITESAFNSQGQVARRDAYVVIAVSDLDGNSTARSTLIATSIQANIYDEDLGE